MICPMRLLARRRGLAQRAPLVSMGLVRRKSASHLRLQLQMKGFCARCLSRGGTGIRDKDCKPMLISTWMDLVAACSWPEAQGWPWGDKHHLGTPPRGTCQLQTSPCQTVAVGMVSAGSGTPSYPATLPLQDFLCLLSYYLPIPPSALGHFTNKSGGRSD